MKAAKLVIETGFTIQIPHFAPSNLSECITDSDCPDHLACGEDEECVDPPHSSCPEWADPSWIGDGYCNDETNIEGCDYDGGDCCGSNVVKRSCELCICHNDTGISNDTGTYVLDRD